MNTKMTCLGPLTVAPELSTHKVYKINCKLKFSGVRRARKQFKQLYLTVRRHGSTFVSHTWKMVSASNHDH